MMTNDEKLMQQALDALEDALADVYSDWEPMQHRAAEALRARLAQPEPPCKTGSQCVGGKCMQCAAQTEPEPVAWMEDSKGNRYDIPEANRGFLLKAAMSGVMPDDLIAAYEKGFADGKAQREWSGISDAQLMDEVRRRGFVIKNAQISEWQGLTDEEISQLEQHYLFGGNEFGDDIGYWAVYRAIEAKLREKNT